MQAVLQSLIPVFLLLATGWATRTARVIDEGQWRGFERVTYYILFPALVAETLARADLASAPLFGVGGALVLAILAVSALLLVLRKPMEDRLGVSGPSFTSVFQGATRWNTFVALALAGALYGNIGATLCAVAIAAMIPLLNVISVLVLSRYAAPARLSASEFALTLARNPFIWSCALGLALNLTGLPLPRAVWSWAEILGRASLPAGLLVVGSGLDLSRLRRPSAALTVSMALKLVVMPLVAASLARLLGVTGAGVAVTVICTAVPTASASYVLARQMGGDAPLMAEIITVQTLAAMATMPLAIALLA
ncbi:AEC family transporter [Alsobacter sp. SYSU M60028]|uniref:AEC family transporter n=1 Tax=Alsobacter ponti TaxID=2962936 RepID=A0ABT1LGL0_9HYPH|nr:AEC family transporter [Alsobacter ponti]MCP8939860.1 AEC family transporter [Alsobacter ponti]